MKRFINFSDGNASAKVIKYEKVNKCIWFFFFILIISNDIFALELKGNYIQGGLIFGKTEKGSKVYLDDNIIPVNKDGNFLIGLGKENIIHISIKNSLYQWKHH